MIMFIRQNKHTKKTVRYLIEQFSKGLRRVFNIMNYNKPLRVNKASGFGSVPRNLR